MKKDIIDLIKEQGNQACVMMPDIMTPPAIDLGEVIIDAGVESIELSTDQKQQLIGFLDKYKNNSLFLLQVNMPSVSVHYKLLMAHSSEIEDSGFNFSMYASNPVNITMSDEQVSICIFVITLAKTEEQRDVFFGIKTLK